VRPWSEYIHEVLAGGQWWPRQAFIAEVKRRASAEIGGRPFDQTGTGGHGRTTGNRATNKIGDVVRELAKDGLIEREGLEATQRLRWVAPLTPSPPLTIAQRRSAMARVELRDEPPEPPERSDVQAAWDDRPRSVQRWWKVPDQ
jgi:hypothetical protein